MLYLASPLPARRSHLARLVSHSFVSFGASSSLYWKRNWFLSQRLSQKWLIGLQILRLVGILFLIEMILGHIPGTFAYPAGLGDILVALVALAVLLAYR